MKKETMAEVLVWVIVVGLVVCSGGVLWLLWRFLRFLGWGAFFAVAGGATAGAGYYQRVKMSVNGFTNPA